MKKHLITLALILMCCIGWFAFQTTSVAAASADLEITEFSWDNESEVKPGTAITFSVKIKNKGNAPISDPFSITFGTTDTTFVKVTYNTAVAAGSSFTVNAPAWTAVAGDYFVVATVDSDNQITESNENNNIVFDNLRVAKEKLTSESKEIQALLNEGGITELIFSEDFDSLATVDTTDSGAIGYKWYVDRPYGASTLTTEDYTVKDGIMTVHNIVPTYNYGLGTYHPDKKVGFTYNTGYMEIRFRIPRPRKNEGDEKGVPAIWALPDMKLTNRTSHWVELDWLEYWGINAYSGNYPNGFYTICLHEQKGVSPVTTWYKNSNYGYQGLGDGEWHTMGWLWQEGLFISYLDGTEIMRQTYGEGQDPSPNNTVQTGEDALGVFAKLDEQMMPIIIGGSKDNPLEVDYVRVWDGGSNDYNPDKVERQEMLPADFLFAYTVDSNGDPIKTVNNDNYMYILYGEEEWKKMSSETQKIVNGALDLKGQASFPDLLKQARAVYDKLNNHTHEYTTVYDKATLTANGAKNIQCKECGKVHSSTTIYRPSSFKLSATSYTYNGAVKTPTVTVKDAAGKTIASSNYTVTYASGRKNAGTYKVTVKMKGVYSGTKTLSFKINPIDISKCAATLSATSYTYNGAVKTPSVTVKNANGTKLTKNTHYTVTYASGRKNAGTYKVTVKMKGNYGGTKTLSFKINPISISKCTVKASNFTYTGSAKVPTVTVKNANGTTLKNGTHYTVSRVTACKNVGTHKVTIKMKGNYSGSKTLSFKINPISISKCSIKVSDFTYTGSAKTPTVTVKNASGTILKNGTHYTVSRVTACKNIGTHKVTIKMKGNYSGSKTVTFKITPPKTEITKLSLNSRSAKITVKQLTSAKASGYQVQHSASSKFTNATTKTTSGYKTTLCTFTLPTTKCTYHVRVRTYKTVNGVRYYSAWNTYSYQKTI